RWPLTSDLLQSRRPPPPPHRLIKPRVPHLPHLLEPRHVPQHVDHSLRHPALDPHVGGELAGVKGACEPGWDELPELICGAEGVRLADADQVLVLAHVVSLSPAAATAVPGESPLLDVDEHDFEGQLRMGKRLGEVDEVIEQVEQPALLGTAAAGKDRATRAIELDDYFAGDDRFDDANLVRLGEVTHLIRDNAQPP